jgi:hypothetical protein
MRSALAKEVRQEFSSKILELYQWLKRITKHELTKKDLVFQWDVAAKLRVYIMLLLSHNEDEFTIEIAWSEKPSFPVAYAASPDEKPYRGGTRFRLCKFWTKNEDWWALAPRESLEEMVDKMQQGKFFDEFPIEEAMEQIKPQVADAITRIQKYAIPYFKKIATQHGCEFESE